MFESDPPRVVIVEESATIGSMLVTLLDAHAFHATHVQSGDDAVQHFQRSPDPIDLLILDLGSAVDVHSTIATCRSRHPECPVLLIGAPRLSEKLGSTHPLWPHLSKPFRSDQLLGHVYTLTRRPQP